MVGVDVGLGVYVADSIGVSVAVLEGVAPLPLVSGRRVWEGTIWAVLAL
jgi:hypothetical protein